MRPLDAADCGARDYYVKRRLFLPRLLKGVTAFINGVYSRGLLKVVNAVKSLYGVYVVYGSLLRTPVGSAVHATDYLRRLRSLRSLRGLQGSERHKPRKRRK